MSVDRRELRRRLFRLAAHQGGYFSASQAKSEGYSYQAQAHHVAAGNWIRVDRGVFRLAEWVPELNDQLSRWTLWSKGRGIVSHASALAVHSIGEFESARVHLTVPAPFSMRDPAVMLHFADLQPGDIVDHPGYRVTTVLRSLIDVAAEGADEDQLGRAIHEAVAAGHLTLRQLRARAEDVDLKAALRIERALQNVLAP